MPFHSITNVQPHRVPITYLLLFQLIKWNENWSDCCTLVIISHNCWPKWVSLTRVNINGMSQKFKKKITLWRYCLYYFDCYSCWYSENWNDHFSFSVFLSLSSVRASLHVFGADNTDYILVVFCLQCFLRNYFWNSFGIHKKHRNCFISRSARSDTFHFVQHFKNPKEPKA